MAFDLREFLAPSWQKIVMSILVGVIVFFLAFFSFREQVQEQDLPALLALGLAFTYLVACTLVRYYSKPTHGITRKFNEFWWPTFPKIIMTLVMLLLFAPLFSYDNGKICPPCAPGQACACRATSFATYLDVFSQPERDYRLFDVLSPEGWAGIALFTAIFYVIICYFFAHYFSLIPKRPASGYVDPMKNTHPLVKALVFTLFTVILIALAAIVFVFAGTNNEQFLAAFLFGCLCLLAALWYYFKSIYALIFKKK